MIDDEKKDRVAFIACTAYADKFTSIWHPPAFAGKPDHFLPLLLCASF
jgi:hypothetical protein